MVSHLGSEPPSIMPKYVTDYVVLREITWQSFINGIGYALNKNKKASWPPLLVVVGAYRFGKVKEALELTHDLERYHFCQGQFKKNNHKGTVKNHCVVVTYTWCYAHEQALEEEIYK